jgi:hypothetical protein
MIQTQKLLSFTGLSFILVFSSCTMEKRVYMPGYYVDWHNQKNNQDKQNIVIYKNDKKTEQNKISTNALLENKTSTPTPTQPINNDNNLLVSTNNIIIPITSHSLGFSKKENSHEKYKPFDTKTKNNTKGSTDDCDIIVLLTGEKIKAKVIEIGEERIKYKLCDNQDGPTISINKSDVSLITHPDGTEEIITADDPNTLYQNYLNKKTPGLTIVGFIASIVSFFVLGFILGTLAIIFGFISLAKIKREPNKYKGRGLAIASIVLGVISVIAIIILLSLVV